MTEYLTEQEQIEILKAWIKQYSLVILTGVLLAFIAITGWRYWQQRQAKIFSHASAVYEEMLAMRAQNDPAATLTQAKKLFTHYPQTIYGQMAALMLARDAVVKKNYPQAETHLNWILKKSSVPSFRQIARIRLARILITEQKSKESIEILQTVDDKSFNGFVEEVKGDAYLALKDNQKARESYQRAITELPNAEIIRPMLQIKYDNLAPSYSTTKTGIS